MAAEHAFGLGRVDLVDKLVQAASRTELTELDWARTQWLREIFSDGVPGDATRVLELCAIAHQALRAGDRDLALNLLLGAALRCWWADTGPAARTKVTAITREIGAAAGDPRYVAALAVVEPVRHCGAVLALLPGLAGADVTDGDTLRCSAWPRTRSATRCGARTSCPGRRPSCARKAGSGCCLRC